LLVKTTAGFSGTAMVPGIRIRGKSADSLAATISKTLLLLELTSFVGSVVVFGVTTNVGGGLEGDVIFDTDESALTGLSDVLFGGFELGVLDTGVEFVISVSGIDVVNAVDEVDGIDVRWLVTLGKAGNDVISIVVIVTVVMYVGGISGGAVEVLADVVEGLV